MYYNKSEYFFTSIIRAVILSWVWFSRCIINLHLSLMLLSTVFNLSYLPGMNIARTLIKHTMVSFWSELLILDLKW